MMTISVKTDKKAGLIDITSEIEAIISKETYTDGVLYIYSPHTTAGITINEGADPAVKQDIINYLDKLISADFNYRHLDGNSPSHIKTSLTGSGAFVFVEKCKLVLGSWQKIFFAEFDGPRNRNVWLKFLKTT
jgi:secondary thiamine-phosphate synthase enzyme